jgi:hypothetical protein
LPPRNFAPEATTELSVFQEFDSLTVEAGLRFALALTL